MPKLTKNKIRTNITIDKELNQILNKKKINKSVLINSLLYKYITLEQNKTLLTNLQSQNSNKRLQGFEPWACGLQDRRSTTEL